MPQDSDSTSQNWLSRCWKKIQYLGFLLVIRLIEWLSLKNAQRLIRRLSGVAYFILGKSRKRAISHALYSGICATKQEAVSLVRESFRNMGSTVVEIVKRHQILTEENYRDRIKIDNVSPEWNALFDPQRKDPMILVTAHLGNWEVAASAFAKLSGHPISVIMRPLDNEYIGEFFYKNRVEKGVSLFSKALGLLPLFRALKRGEDVVFVADQHAGSKEGVEIQFCGKPARAHASPSLLSWKSKYKIVALALVRLDTDFHFLFTGAGPVDYTPTGNKATDIQNITQIYSSLLEQLVRKYPEQWLWPHRRWLHFNRR